MIRRLFLPTVVLLLAACGSKTPTQPAAGPGGGGPGAVAGTLVTISGSGGSSAEVFSPNPVSVTAGLGLIFRNTDTITHRIVADNGTWDTGVIAAGALSTTIVTTTAVAGSFHCTLHSGATGTLTVTGGRGGAH